ncbi:hypothetical protein [Streptomyces chartreusis]|uniref:hypothetical protein n=1 Tax=Streptomyces chartreusis TaxID=1969 RepID=UPI00364993A2
MSQIGTDRLDETFLDRYQTQVEHEAKRFAGQCSAWKKWSTVLSVTAALGSAVAGGLTVGVENLTGGWQLTIALVAFGGAGFSAAAAAVGGPQRVSEAQHTSVQLGALKRRLEVLTELKRNGDSVEPSSAVGQFMAATLDRLDAIYGGEVPEELKLTPDNLAKLYNNAPQSGPGDGHGG